jgi:hypothetical protein
MPQVIDERTQRLREAIAKQDKKYLEAYEEGLDAGASGKDREPPKTRRGSRAWDDGYAMGERQRPPESAEDAEKKQPSNEVPEFGAGGGPNIEEDDVELIGHPVNVGFHPLGGLSIAVRQKDGTVAQARITVEQAWTTIGHLQALTAMLIHATYAQMAQMQQAGTPDLIVPGR